MRPERAERIFVFLFFFGGGRFWGSAAVATIKKLKASEARRIIGESGGRFWGVFGVQLQAVATMKIMDIPT